MPVVAVEAVEQAVIPTELNLLQAGRQATELSSLQVEHQALVEEHKALQERYNALQGEHSLTVAELEHIRSEQTGLLALHNLRDAKRAVHSRRLKITAFLLTVGVSTMSFGVIIAGTRTMGVSLLSWHDIRTVKAAQPYWVCAVFGLGLMLLAVLPTDTFAVRCICTVLGCYAAMVSSTFCVMRVVLVLSGQLDGDFYSDSSGSKILDALLHAGFAVSVTATVVYIIPRVLQRKQGYAVSFSGICRRPCTCLRSFMSTAWFQACQRLGGRYRAAVPFALFAPVFWVAAEQKGDHFSVHTREALGMLWLVRSTNTRDDPRRGPFGCVPLQASHMR